MTFERAIAILGLSKDFTEQELKTTWRKLSKEHHPDKNASSEESIKKQQEINLAHEYLKKYISPTSKNSAKFNIDEYIRKKINELDNIIKYNGPDIEDEDLKKTYDDIKKVIATFKTDVFITYTLNKQDVDQSYELCKTFIKVAFETFVSTFYKKHYIDENKVIETINFNCTLKELYDQLLKIKEKYGKETITKKRVETEIEKYKNYAGYEKLELLIDVYKNQTIYNITQNNFQNIEQEIVNMHQQIEKEVFETYYSLKKKILDLEVTLSTIDDEKIKDEYKNIKEHFENGSSFAIAENALKKLEELIHKYQEEELKRNKYRENEQAINQIYKSLIDRYSEALKSYNIVTEYTAVSTLSKLLQQILQIFSKGCEEFQDLEYFNHFNDITFTNMNADEKTVLKAIQTLKKNKSNIYIKITDRYMFDDSSFFWFDEENMIMYKVGYDTSFRKITQEEFETEYIPLEKILESSLFIGKHMRMLSSSVKVLYENDRVVLYYYNKHFSVSSKAKFYNSSFYQESNQLTDDSFDQFKNKQSVCEMIKKQIKEKVEEYKKKQSQTYGDTQFNNDDGNYCDKSREKRKR